MSSSLEVVDVSRFDAVPLIAFIAAKVTDYRNETNGRVPGWCGSRWPVAWCINPV